MIYQVKLSEDRVITADLSDMLPIDTRFLVREIVEHPAKQAFWDTTVQLVEHKVDMALRKADDLRYRLMYHTAQRELKQLEIVSEAFYHRGEVLRELVTSTSRDSVLARYNTTLFEMGVI